MDDISPIIFQLLVTVAMRTSFRVHGPEDSQEAVFEEVKSLLTSLLDGWAWNYVEKKSSISSQMLFRWINSTVFI